MRFRFDKPLLVLLSLLLNPLPLPANCENATEAARRFYLSGKTLSALKTLDKCLSQDHLNRKSLLFFIEILPEKNSPRLYKTLLRVSDKALKEKNDDYAYYLGLCKYYRNKDLIRESLSELRESSPACPYSLPRLQRNRPDSQ